MSRFLYENLRGSPTLILLNVLGVLGVLNVLHVPHTCASYMCFMCFICPWTHRLPAGPCLCSRSRIAFVVKSCRTRLCFHPSRPADRDGKTSPMPWTTFSTTALPWNWTARLIDRRPSRPPASSKDGLLHFAPQNRTKITQR